MAEFFDKDVECKAESRKMSISEQFYVPLCQTPFPQSNYFHYFTINCKNSIDIAEVSHTFFELSKLHFLMRCYLEKDENEDYWFKESPLASNAESWVYVEEIALQKDEDWCQYVSPDLNKSFDLETGPLWRVKWIPCNTTDSGYKYVLLFVCFHGICDAKSVNDLIANQFFPLLLEKQLQAVPAPFPKPMEQVVSASDEYISTSELAIPWYVKTLVNTVVSINESRLSAQKRRRYETAALKRDASQSSHHAFLLDVDTSQAFMKVCKQNQCSVHSLLTVIVAVSARQLAQATNILLNNFAHIGFPIDLRKFARGLSQSPVPMGDYATVAFVKTKSKDLNHQGEVLKEAQKLTPEIKKLASKVPAQNSGFIPVMLHFVRLGKVKELYQYFGKYPKLFISNLGNCGSDNETITSYGIQVENQGFGVSTNDTLFLSVTTYNDVMSFCFSYDNGWFEKENIVNCADLILENIKEMVKGSTTEQK